jgi:methionyl-tRNA synthetase
VSIIRGDPKLKRMTPDDVLARIINHELLLEEAKYVKNLSKGIVSTKKDNITLKASKNKQILVESSSEEEQEDDDEDEEKEYDEEDMALLIKKFNKYMNKRRPFKGDKKEKTRSKRVCYNCGKNGHFIAQCPY